MKAHWNGQVKYGYGVVVAQETLWEPSEITNAATQCQRLFTGEQSGGLLSAGHFEQDQAEHPEPGVYSGC